MKKQKSVGHPELEPHLGCRIYLYIYRWNFQTIQEQEAKFTLLCKMSKKRCSAEYALYKLDENPIRVPGRDIPDRHNSI